MILDVAGLAGSGGGAVSVTVVVLAGLLSASEGALISTAEDVLLLCGSNVTVSIVTGFIIGIACLRGFIPVCSMPDEDDAGPTDPLDVGICIGVEDAVLAAKCP